VQHLHTQINYWYITDNKQHLATGRHEFSHPASKTLLAVLPVALPLQPNVDQYLLIKL